ncbi:hypothetical protein B0T10DRAFT_135850 [Thelonectria olida]|uniref:Infection structure specific protein n=1 Tax=Thelonectria olida TaxID=1576542 RepID=A0A9P9AM40_9HYPO|nr:hypothetical protein B0T10DRAFT_135850 [Thelonectria olida]
MYTSNLSLFVSALAISFTTAEPAAPEKRDAQECSTAVIGALPALNAIPTPDSSLQTFLAQQTQWTTITDTCVVPAVTGSLADDYTSWMRSFESWISEHKPELSSAFDACSDVPAVQAQLSSYGLTGAATQFCDEYTYLNAAGSATQTAAPSGNAAGTDTTNSVNAGARETGMGVAAAAAMAGFAVAGVY